MKIVKMKSLTVKKINMITVYCVNIKGQRFEKVFDNYRQAYVFILRCKHGKNVYVSSFATENKDCAEELSKLLTY